MITLRILGTEKVVSNLLAMTPKLRTTLKKAMQKSLVTLLRLVKDDYLSGRACMSEPDGSGDPCIATCRRVRAACWASSAPT